MTSEKKNIPDENADIINEQTAVLSDEELAKVDSGTNMTENIIPDAPGEVRKPMDPKAPKIPANARETALR